MALDLTEMEVLLQRRYNCLYEIHRLTKEMLEMVSRRDEVSLSLMLDMRAEEMEKYSVCQIRKKTVELISEVQQLDQLLGLRIHAGQPR